MGGKGVSHPSAWGASANQHPRLPRWAQWNDVMSAVGTWGPGREPRDISGQVLCPGLGQVPPGPCSSLGSLRVTPGSPHGQTRRRKEASLSSLESWSLSLGLVLLRSRAGLDHGWGHWLGPPQGQERPGSHRTQPAPVPSLMLWEGPRLCARVRGGALRPGSGRPRGCRSHRLQSPSSDGLVSPSPGGSPADQDHPGPLLPTLWGV